MKKALFIAATIGLSIAYAASSYHVTLYRRTSVNGTDLKPGDCKVEVLGDKVLIKQGKTSVEAQVKVETGNTRFDATTVGYNGDNAHQLHEIRLGGTSKMLVFETNEKPLSADGSK